MPINHLKRSAARFLSLRGVSADFLTWIGLFFAFLCGVLVFLAEFYWAGAALLLSGLCDLLDGEVARVSGKDSAYGGILDSTLDRYGDGFVLGSLALTASFHGLYVFSIFALSALLGSFSISYVRARAECEMDSCRTGFWERGERLVFLALGLLVRNAALAVVILGIATHWTVFQRLRLAHRTTAAGTQSLPDAKPPMSRTSKAYLIKAATLAAALLIFRFTSNP